MINDVTLDIEGLFRQSKITAREYFLAADEIIEESKFPEIRLEAVIELAKVMAQDFHTGIMALKMQEIRDAVYEVSKHIEETS
jgi:hypothetical protein